MRHKEYTLPEPGTRARQMIEDAVAALKAMPEPPAYSIKARLKKYGLSLQEYEAMLAAGCGICGKKANETRLEVDHCHNNLLVRGMLCRSCNGALGVFRDDPRRLAAAIAYLKTAGCDQHSHS